MATTQQRARRAPRAADLIETLYETGELEYAEKVAHTAAEMGFRLASKWVRDPGRSDRLPTRAKYRLFLDGTILLDDDLDHDEWADLAEVVRELEDYAAAITPEDWAEISDTAAGRLI